MFTVPSSTHRSILGAAAGLHSGRLWSCSRCLLWSVGVAVTGRQRKTRSGQVTTVYVSESVGTWPRWDTRGQMCDSPTTGIDAATDVTRQPAVRQLHSQVLSDAELGVPTPLLPHGVSMITMYFVCVLWAPQDRLYMIYKQKQQRREDV